jgi:hypothetical protein
MEDGVVRHDATNKAHGDIVIVLDGIVADHHSTSSHTSREVLTACIDQTDCDSLDCGLQKEPRLAIGKYVQMSTKNRACCVKRGALHVNDTLQEINQGHIRQKICCISVILHHQISIRS